MEDTIVCPGCQAQLTLPSMPAGQTVQCPRCQRVFEPTRRPVVQPPPTAPKPRETEPDESDLFDAPRRLFPTETLIGPWFGYLTMAALAAFALTFLVRSYVEYELADRIERDINGRLPFGPDFRFQRQVEFWQTATTWVALPCFALWLFLASKNARRLYAGGFSLSPGWVLGIFCCPILNLIFVYLNLQEIWRASDPRQLETMESWRGTSPGALIRLWGLNVLCAPLLFFCIGRNGPHTASWLFAVVNLNIAIIAALMIAIIYLIQVRQQQRYARLYEDPD